MVDHPTYRFHIPALVHLPVSKKFSACAFTMKIYHMCQMLMSLGHEVFLYGAEGSNPPCTEHIQTHTFREIRDTWGDPDCNKKYPRGHLFYETGYDWHNEAFRHDICSPRTDLTRKFDATCIMEINKRKRGDDFLLIMQGTYQKPIDDAVKLYLTCEPGVGYTGTYSKFRAFESSAVMHYIYGRENVQDPGFCDGRHYDRVIPNYFDPDDFKFRRKKDDYFLYMGRIIRRKGLGIAHATCRHLGKKLVIAGQGVRHWDGKTLVSSDITLEGGDIEYVGTVGPKKRSELMGRARALFAPTIYVEPFGCVHMEAQLCGTPVITTDHGVFRDTVVNGMNGYRCHTMNDFIEAALNVTNLKPDRIRHHASRYLMDQVRWKFQKWFEDLHRVWDSTQFGPDQWKTGRGKGWFWCKTPPVGEP